VAYFSLFLNKLHFI